MKAISYPKLSSFLEKRKFLVRRFFSKQGLVQFIEVLSLTSTDLFLIYIPEERRFSPEDTGITAYKLEQISDDYIKDPKDNFPEHQDFIKEEDTISEAKTEKY